jgi:hypothetical protein
LSRPSSSSAWNPASNHQAGRENEPSRKESNGAYSSKKNRECARFREPIAGRPGERYDAAKEIAMIELTEAQRQELKGNGEHARLLDPATRTEYVLVRADLYEQLRPLLEQAEDEAEQAAWSDAVEEARSEMANE